MILANRRAVLAGALGALAATAAGAARAQSHAPFAMSLARPAVPPLSALGLQITDASGAPFDLGALRGNHLILNFWAPWCLPCRREMPALSRAAAALADLPLRFLPVSYDWRGASGVRRFYTETGITNLPVLLGAGENLKATLGIETLPSTALADGAGKVVQWVAGEAVWDDPASLRWLRELAARG